MILVRRCQGPFQTNQHPTGANKMSKRMMPQVLRYQGTVKSGKDDRLSIVIIPTLWCYLRSTTRVSLNH